MSPSRLFCPLCEVPSIGPDGTGAEGAKTVALRPGRRSVPEAESLVRQVVWSRRGQVTVPTGACIGARG